MTVPTLIAMVAVVLFAALSAGLILDRRRLINRQRAADLQRSRREENPAKEISGIDQKALLRAHAAELETRNQRLKEMQMKLVQAEKMASLGNLVAGIAHEVNSPIGALTANVATARKALASIRRTLEIQGSNSADERLGTNKLLDALDRLNDTNDDVARRISKIVASLRSFACLDEAARQRVDIHDCIESVVNLLEHDLGDRIRVERHYAELPQIDCLPSQLNQAFLKILSNSIEAIPGEGQITIGTELAAGQVVITIRDDGVGISKSSLDRVFDPGYTTKGVGVGTGLGLSIAYRIMQEHEGTIEITSERGQGTTVCLRLPVR